jgi:hypothetical protein
MGKPPPMAARLEKALPFRRECCRSLGFSGAVEFVIGDLSFVIESNQFQVV